MAKKWKVKLPLLEEKITVNRNFMKIILLLFLKEEEKEEGVLPFIYLRKSTEFFLETMDGWRTGGIIITVACE